MKIAVVGHGYVGKAYADWLESKGHHLIRYGLEPQLVGNRDKVREASIVLIAVPTPTVDGEQDVSAVKEAMLLAEPRSLVVIKSTVLPGTTDHLANLREGVTVFVPEFLRGHSAGLDVQTPDRVVIGLPEVFSDRKDVTQDLLQLLPRATKAFITSAKTAEFIKYASNIMLVAKLVTANALYDSMPKGADWSTVIRAVEADPRIGRGYMNAVAKGQRGAGGHCLPKDLAAFNGSRDLDGFLDALEQENLRLLRESGKEFGFLDERAA